MKTGMAQKLRPAVQLGCLAIYLSLVLSGGYQLWKVGFLLSFLLAALVGRYYCGWMCPINTLMRPVKWLSQKLRLEKKAVPAFIASGRWRWLVFAFFAGLFVLKKLPVFQGKLPVPAIIIASGLLVTLFINERAWHRYLCPWGIMLGLTGRFARFGLRAAECRLCRRCLRRCPAEAIRLRDNRIAIDPRYCLLCLDCQAVCPEGAIRAGKPAAIVPEAAKPDYAG